MNWYNDVKEFHKVSEQRVGSNPAIPEDISERELRIDLLEEEFNEYLTAEEKSDIIGIADALADIIYIACGTAVSYGIPLDKVFEEVHKSNMNKLVDGKIIRRHDGKILKPEGWRPPDIQKFITTS